MLLLAVRYQCALYIKSCLFKACYRVGHVPPEWKNALICCCLIHKKGDEGALVENYIDQSASLRL